MNIKPRLFLIDGMALAYRVYYAFARNPLTNSRGENISVVYGFSNTLFNLLKDENPEYLAVVFDTSEPTFRHKLYEEYKSNREEMPQDMSDQLPRITELLKALDIPIVLKDGFEADDVIGTLAKQAVEKNLQSVIVSGDKDLLQLVDDSIVVLDPGRAGSKPQWLDADGVKEKMGVPPEKIKDFLALTGDTSDNIPGVKGIGPKTATRLLTVYDSLQDILAHLDSMKDNRTRTKIEKDQEEDNHLQLSEQLTTIDLNVPLNLSPLDLKRPEIDSEKAFKFFQSMQIHGMMNRFAPEKQKIETEYNCVCDDETFDGFIKELAQQSHFAFDTETTSSEPMRAELVGLSFSWKSGQAWYLPVKGPDMLTEEEQPLDIKLVLAKLKPILEDESITKCAHNAKYDIIVLWHSGIYVRGLLFDTMVANYLLNPSVRQHSLDALSLHYFDVKKIPIKTLIGAGKKEKTMDQIPIKQVSDYAGEDADMTWRLWELLKPKMQEMNLERLMTDIEVPLIYVLAKMEYNGVSLDLDYLRTMSKELQSELTSLEKRIYELAGIEFNINSPKQLGKILFEELELPVVRRTKTGYSTDVSVLEELAKSHDLPKSILDYRQLAKLKSTYVDALPKLIHPKTGKIHTSFNQTIAATGRLSSSNPNLQNIPIRTSVGRKIRNAFIPLAKGHVLIDADYSQIELRIMAHLSGDETLIEAFRNDKDVHTRTAALIFDVEEQAVSADQRRKAKEVNFGIMYGMGAYGLANRLDISPEQANEFIKSYFANYPDVQRFMVDIVHKARENGFVTTLYDRRRYVPEIKSDNRRVRDFAERTAINTPIQGSAADLIKIAMIRIQKRLEAEQLQTLMIIQVHDELLFDCPESELKDIEPLIRQEMEDAISLNVPIRVDIGAGASWLEAH
ncbi:MAG: DNA polymerase I [candidate division KSB1 bacterium]|nr:DNA polymerase I [candidate division KSB1 bacterium]